MKTVTVHQAKTNLAKLIEEACKGKDVVIVRGSKPLVRLAPIADARGRRKPGALRGKLRIGPEFFEPLPEDELARWE
jgi:prevent-host-death family protein